MGVESITAIDLFCGAGGLSQGLKESGIKVVAGVDLDEACEYPFTANHDAIFLNKDVTEVTGAMLEAYWEPGSQRLLAGCAPCQPFSKHRRGADTTTEKQWPLLGEFARLVEETLPEFVTMENVPGMARTSIFEEFVGRLENSGYFVDFTVCYAPKYGLAQRRKRLVLVASRVGEISVPKGDLSPVEFRTVRDVLGALPTLVSGAQDPDDSLHIARKLSDTNIRRIRASVPGGDWRDWPEDLVLACHKKASGGSFKNVYGRMEWDQPAPTITTQPFNYGAGRFGHPDQDRPISLREAAVLQGFPKDYRFVKPGEKVRFAVIGRLIGNAVPPALGRVIGQAFQEIGESA